MYVGAGDVCRCDVAVTEKLHNIRLRTNKQAESFPMGSNSGFRENLASGILYVHTYIHTYNIHTTYIQTYIHTVATVSTCIEHRLHATGNDMDPCWKKRWDDDDY
jgi:hypothetical protein